MRWVIFSLLLHYMAIEPSENLQLTEKLEAQIAELNKKIEPIAILVNEASNISINGLLQDLEGGLQSGIQTSGTVNLDKAFYNNLLYILGLRNSWEFHPFTPATNKDGTLKCLSKYQDNYCTEDASYPKWYMKFIESEVAETLTELQPAFETNPCGTYNDTSKLICENRTKSSSPQSLEVITATNQGTIKEYNFVLQTDSLQQRLTTTICVHPDQNCTGPRPDDPHKCTEVGAWPDYERAGRSDEKSVILAVVVDKQGLVAVKETTGIKGPCFCICD